MSEVFQDTDSLHRLLDGQVELRARVDRKRFEQYVAMGLDIDGTVMSLDSFMTVVMSKTKTMVTFPSSIRSGPRSKKDPHVKIVGRDDDVEQAKQLIMVVFDVRAERVTLKMDVSFTDHSIIIGRGGKLIQSVMDDTGCHIHFPDSNRTNTFEKSNQVSIAGTAAGSETARCKIRNLQPVSIVYDIPTSSIVIMVAERWTSLCQAVQRNFSLVVSMKTMRGPSVYSSFGTSTDFVRLSIRGTRMHVLGLRQGIALLLKELTSGSLTFTNAPASLETEVAAQHHSFVMGKGNANIRRIQQTTGTVITFPDNISNSAGLAAAPAASSVPMKRSTVFISGPNFDAVFMAWQELTSCLPLLLLFDLREGQDLDAALITQLMERLKVSILIKPKQKANYKTIMVRGPEKESRVLFEVRRQIMGLPESEVPYCCPEHQPGLSLPSISSFLQNFSLTANPERNCIPSSPWHPEPKRSSTLTSITDSMIRDLDGLKLKHDYPNGYGQVGQMYDGCFQGPETPLPKYSPSNLSMTSEEYTPTGELRKSFLFPDSNERYLVEKKVTNTNVTVNSPRFPDNRFCGQGFSETTPASVFRSMKSNSLYPEYLPLPKASSTASSTVSSVNGYPDLDDDTWRSDKRVPFSESDHFVRPGSSGFPSTKETNTDNIDLAAILSGLGLGQFLNHFRSISFSKFITLNENDLVTLGINYSAGRYKILVAIKQLKAMFKTVHLSEENDDASNTSFDIAPGAGRRPNLYK
ncbi:Protein bicaudal C -like protein 1 [Halotydeus destructor]|nr:Protein bicaudal C -like protein 1 [Halotydeus destructor]